MSFIVLIIISLLALLRANGDSDCFAKLNLERGCPFFKNEHICGLRDCRVNDCSDEELPLGLRDKSTNLHAHDKYSEKYNKGGDGDVDCDLGQLDSSLSEERQIILENWTRHDTDLLTFCEPDDDRIGKLIYVDLLKNPERYTGYKGPSSHRIWFMVYNENCFKFLFVLGKTCLLPHDFWFAQQYQHSSFLPLSNELGSKKGFTDPRDNDPGWGPNVNEFRRRFDPSTVPEGSLRLRNLYFTYLVELRALAKAAPYLLKQKYYTGDPQTDLETQRAVEELLNIIKEHGNYFDERLLFAVDNPETVMLKQQFRDHFHNISRIMDCVSCDKCRLWGKLQTQGMGTALKILFSKATPGDSPAFHLTRTEIVALFNAFGRLSTSIGALPDFCDLMNKPK